VPATDSERATRRPLLYVSRAVARHAGRLLPGRMLEREVQEAILAGNVNAGRHGGYVFGDTWVARVARVPGRLREKPRAWLVVAIERRRG
jgi:hypothetical protein